LHHVKLTAFAKEVGVIRPTIARIKNGDKTVPYNALQKVSDYFEGITSEE